MIEINDSNREDLEKGYLCPKCGSNTATYRHPWAKRWCIYCDFVLNEEGSQVPYNYKLHLIQESYLIIGTMNDKNYLLSDELDSLEKAKDKLLLCYLDNKMKFYDKIRIFKGMIA